MTRLLSIGLIIVLAASLTSCGNVFVGGALQPHGSSTITGIVSFVQLTTEIFGGTASQVTFVTFLVGATSSVIGFCGNQSNQFPLNQQVTTNFNSSQTCATLVAVIIIG